MRQITKGIAVLFLALSLNANEMPSDLQDRAVSVLNNFINILHNNSFDKSAVLIVPLVHKSLLGRQNRKLNRDTYRFSFKKAHTHAKNYAYPVVVTRVQKLKTTGIGYGDKYGKGVEYKIWIDKKSTSLGRPAPIVLFFLNGEGKPKLSYIGSL